MEQKSLELRHDGQSSRSSAQVHSRTTPNPTSELTVLTDPPANSTQFNNLGMNLLHSPTSPLIDLIFVHGLGGHPRKTWSSTSSMDDFWPQQWLPKDPAFKAARIHSFGYSAGIKKGESTILNIHHFGQALLSELNLSPHLSEADSPIVLLGHSMGGLIIKKTYILAKQDPIYGKLSNRIRTMLFFATPHRGSNLAGLLHYVLYATFKPRAYIEELKHGSKVITEINEEFEGFIADMNLWSFYETRKLGIGPFDKIIVEPTSAVLGCPGEKVIPMNANHRSICKFDSSRDPNYLMVRNALATIISNLVPQSTITTRPTTASQSHGEDLPIKDQLRTIREFLRVDGRPEDDLISAEDARLDGTCDWMAENPSFMEWKDFQSKAPTVYWLKGNPGTGKSVMAGSIIGRLSESKPSYFFFKHGHNEKSQLHHCLRSLAYQMACDSAESRQTILAVQQDEPKLDVTNERTLWRKLFLSGMLRVSLKERYWVLDGLDECSNASPLFESMLNKIDDSIRLRVLITSRETTELKTLFLGLGEYRVKSDRISESDTLGDIQLLANVKSRSLLAFTDEARLALVTKVVEKSRGSFLWTTLVLKELSQAHGEREVQKVLDEVPSGMEALYHRILDAMSAMRSKALGKAILMWVVCAVRPLTIKELEGALEFDINETFPTIKESIAATCGQLVNFDRSGRVQMVHATAREFLLQDSLRSEFAIDMALAHTRISRSCLNYLNGPELKPPRGSRQPPTACRIEFSKYACEAFSAHLAKSSTSTGDILALLNRFLERNVASWIEHVASTKDLTRLVEAAQNLRSFINTCTMQKLVDEAEVCVVRAWTKDLAQITAKFSDALIISPSAIYWGIPPFCPTTSEISKLNTNRRKISISGVELKYWDDRLTSFGFEGSIPTALVYGEEFFAVAVFEGTITLYHAKTYQKHIVLEHGGMVKFLQFKSNSDLLASCDRRMIHIWNIKTGRSIYSLPTPTSQWAMAMVFAQSSLMIASSNGYLASWDIGNKGDRLLDHPWCCSEDVTRRPPNRWPNAVAISLEHEMLAVAYPHQEITLWDLEQDNYYGTCGSKSLNGKTSTHPVERMVFNPNPAMELLAVSYLDDNVAILNPFQDLELAKLRIDCRELAASPNGQFLAVQGVDAIRIYEFNNLRLIYRVDTLNMSPRGLSFNSDGSRLAEIRGNQCSIWAPSSLISGTPWDGSIGNYPSMNLRLQSHTVITCMATDPSYEFVICGKSNGSVSSYDLKDGLERRTLYCHKCEVNSLIWWPGRNIVVSVDIANKVAAWYMEKTTQNEWRKKVAAFHIETLDNGVMPLIKQVLPNMNTDDLLLSSLGSVFLRDINGDEKQTRHFNHDDVSQKLWLQHPSSEMHLLSFDGKSARVWNWSDLLEVASYPLEYYGLGLKLESVISYRLGQKHIYLLELLNITPLSSVQKRGLDVVDGAIFNTQARFDDDDGTFETQHQVLVCNDSKRNLCSGPMKQSQPAQETILRLPTGIAQNIAHILGGNSKGQLTYLDHKSWVCSLDMGDVTSGNLHYTRHFFIPQEWFPTYYRVVSCFAKQDVVLARGDGIAIVKGGLDFAERVPVEEWRLHD